MVQDVSVLEMRAFHLQIPLILQHSLYIIFEILKGIFLACLEVAFLALFWARGSSPFMASCRKKPVSNTCSDVKILIFCVKCQCLSEYAENHVTVLLNICKEVGGGPF